MRVYVAVSILLFFAGCAATTPEAVFKPPAPAFELSIQRFTPPETRTTALSELLPAGHAPGQGINVCGMQLVPIFASGAPTETPYVTLHEALERGLAIVREDGTAMTRADGTTEYQGGNVNHVRVTNRADSPLFLMVGDLLFGGQQDRIVARTVVVEPQTEDQVVKVYCVEQGRWEPDATQPSTGGLFYRRAAQDQVDPTVKAAALSGGQGSVWEAVGLNNARLGVTRISKSGSFRAVFDDEATRKRLNKLAASAGALCTTDTVGFALLNGNDVRAMDVFDSKALCAKLSDKLIRSYLVTALSGAHASPPAMHPLAERLADNATLNIHCMPLHIAASRIQRDWGVPLRVGPGCNPYYPVDIESSQADMLSVFEGLASTGMRIEIRTTEVVLIATPVLATAEEQTESAGESEVPPLPAHLDSVQFGSVVLHPEAAGAFFGPVGFCNPCGGYGYGGTGNSAGFFFQDMPPSNVRVATFNQDIRGRFEALADIPSFTTTLGVGTPVAIQQTSVPISDPEPINYSFTDQKRESNVHRSFLRR